MNENRALIWLGDLYRFRGDAVSADFAAHCLEDGVDSDGCLDCGEYGYPRDRIYFAPIEDEI